MTTAILLLLTFASGVAAGRWWFTRRMLCKYRSMRHEHARLFLEAAKIEMTPEQREEQARSFAYGNLAIDRPGLTREEFDRYLDGNS